MLSTFVDQGHNIDFLEDRAPKEQLDVLELLAAPERRILRSKKNKKNPFSAITGSYPTPLAARVGSETKTAQKVAPVRPVSLPLAPPTLPTSMLVSSTQSPGSSKPMAAITPQLSQTTPPGHKGNVEQEATNAEEPPTTALTTSSSTSNPIQKPGFVSLIQDAKKYVKEGVNRKTKQKWISEVQELLSLLKG